MVWVMLWQRVSRMKELFLKQVWKEERLLFSDCDDTNEEVLKIFLAQDKDDGVVGQDGQVKWDKGRLMIRLLAIRVKRQGQEIGGMQ